MAGKGPLNYTTSIDAEKTALECVTMLMRFGAKNVALSVGEEKIPDGLDFTVMLPWGPRQYSLPVNAAGTQKALLRAYREGRISKPHTSSQQAVRVAWRVMRDWLDVQLALIEAGGVELAQVMLPYMKVSPDKTLYGAWVEDEMKAIGGTS